MFAHRTAITIESYEADAGWEVLQTFGSGTTSAGITFRHIESGNTFTAAVHINGCRLDLSTY